MAFGHEGAYEGVGPTCGKVPHYTWNHSLTNSSPRWKGNIHGGYEEEIFMEIV